MSRTEHGRRGSPEPALLGRRRRRAVDDALDGLLVQPVVLLGPGVEDEPLHRLRDADLRDCISCQYAW